jgi:betaine-homocysteine S-methyltransferase
MHKNILLEKLSKGPLVCAEGYIFELEQRGYLQAGSFVPTCILSHPDVVRQLHRDFVHAGSDVVLALTYYAHKEKMTLIGKEDETRLINEKALQIAKEVAEESGSLFAGNICNTNLWVKDGEKDQELVEKVRGIFEEQVRWAKEAGCKFIVAETYGFLEEARLALKVIKSFNLPAVVTLVIHRSTTRDDWELEDAVKELEHEGADVVGLNCYRGPETMLPLLERVVKSVKIPVAALPVPYRTTENEPTFMCLTDDKLPACTVNGRPFPTALDGLRCTRYEVEEFTRKAQEIGVQYFGLCCGNVPSLTRSMAEALGKCPPASVFSPDMSLHFAFGNNSALVKDNLKDVENL